MMQETENAATQLQVAIYADILKNNKYLEQFLQKYKVAYVAVPDGRMLMQTVRAQKPTIAIMDVQMPFVSGLDALRMIKMEAPETKTVLLSDIGSHSIGQSAVDLEVDLYSDQNRRAVHLLYFLNAALGFKDRRKLPRKGGQNLSGSNSSQRMKDRYPVSGSITMIYDGKKYPGMFENISVGGVKMRISHIPPISSKVGLEWMFQNEKMIAVNGIIVRQSMVFEPQDEYVWVVGVQFVDMNDAQIQDIQYVVDFISKFYKDQFDIVDFDHIKNMLGAKDVFFRPFLAGHKPSKLIEKALKDVHEYERQSFGSDKEKDKCIAQMMSLRVTARLLRRSLEWVSMHPDVGLTKSVPLIHKLMLEMDNIEADADELIREEPNAEFRKLLVQSSNILLEQKDKLIQAFHDRCATLLPIPEHKDFFDSLLSRYEDLQSYKHFLEVDAIAQAKNNLSQPPTSKPKADASAQDLSETSDMEIDMPDVMQEMVDEDLKRKEKEKALISQELKKIQQNILPVLTLAVVLSITLSFVMGYIQSFVSNDELSLDLATQSMRIRGRTSLEIRADTRTWESLSPSRQRKVLDDIEVYLTANGLFQAKIQDGETNIAAVMSTHDPDFLRFYPLTF